jgi:hypothetical protein
VVRSFMTIAALLMQCTYLSADDEGTFVGTDFNDTYTVNVTRAALQRTPSWNKQTANPPLSARKSIKLATDFKNSFVKDAPDWKWRFESIGLRHGGSVGAVDKWYWVALYREWPLTSAPGWSASRPLCDCSYGWDRHKTGR